MRLTSALLSALRMHMCVYPAPASHHVSESWRGRTHRPSRSPKGERDDPGETGVGAADDRSSQIAVPPRRLCHQVLPHLSSTCVLDAQIAEDRPDVRSEGCSEFRSETGSPGAEFGHSCPQINQSRPVWVLLWPKSLPTLPSLGDYDLARLGKQSKHQSAAQESARQLVPERLLSDVAAPRPSMPTALAAAELPTRGLTFGPDYMPRSAAGCARSATRFHILVLLSNALGRTLPSMVPSRSPNPSRPTIAKDAPQSDMQ